MIIFLGRRFRCTISYLCKFSTDIILATGRWSQFDVDCGVYEVKRDLEDRDHRELMPEEFEDYLQTRSHLLQHLYVIVYTGDLLLAHPQWTREAACYLSTRK